MRSNRKHVQLKKRSTADILRANAMYAPFTERALRVIRSIPNGKVASYGQIAALSGSPQAARQVVRILHTLSEREKLPWHRVIGSRGAISLPKGAGFEEQKSLLEAEGVRVAEDGKIGLSRYSWTPSLEEPPL
jgi:methylated-DNA-protein-cysteine methyltransferase-like protein